MSDKKAIIIGAGPAGLTAAYELLERTSITPVVIEMDNQPGGLARTINYKGNLIDIGGHRFFSKSDRVMEWWMKMMPIEQIPPALKGKLQIAYQGSTREIGNLSSGIPADSSDAVMLIRRRRSRILYEGKFYDYPVSLNSRTISNLGYARLIRIVASYFCSVMKPRQEKNLEDFFINRFGRELYETFFRDYTEKVWRVPCSQISPEWGAQRIKGLSGWKTFTNFVQRALSARSSLSQKNLETSLIEWFLYPKQGSGQMWERAAKAVLAKGGELRYRQRVKSIRWCGRKISSVITEDLESGATQELEAGYLFSTMPVRDLVMAMGDDAPLEVRSISSALVYRDFLTVGVLIDRARSQGARFSELEANTWIYVQEKALRVGRIQVFNNWSPYMVASPNLLWIGMEYFVDRGDPFWEMSDEKLIRHASEELGKLGLAGSQAVLDGTVVRVPNAYPAYFGSYKHFSEVRAFLDRFENLFPLGRNGMHRYNNQDHSMLTAMMAVDCIVTGSVEKSNLWRVNAESEYIESSPGPGSRKL